ncbi:Leucine-rich repeat transmembrane protein kinase [Perilla frutescens var. hirtella]|uniref:non-specific serine/threonine protein kinase n=1 Tax=Perilla frutescens var. hirtella TaxID=608512 RepID=A0AAD4JNU1_PERFH|nr:Leucine-rich repeat transmembrane protein kinase [Perilla frutescens var. hirtella]
MSQYSAIQGNRITGSIPRELANITTLEELVLDFNLLSGAIPPELGNLPQLKRLMLASNNFTGDLPASLANLVTLSEFRINDNNFTGNIPNFIQNWTNITKLMIQGSGLSGPIPPGIASLTQLTDLIISDLNGNNESTFPPLSNMPSLQNLVLRSCNIVGKLPPYIGNMTKSKYTLDLSFNRLSGDIPESFSNLLSVEYIYLSGNFLSGPIPHWMLTKGKNIDLSYNNFSSKSPEQNCQARSNLNLFASSRGNTSGTFTCTGGTCDRKYNSLRINCGGRRVSVEKGYPYEDDISSVGPSNLIRSRMNWGFSSTGNWQSKAPDNSYTLTTSSNISGPNADLYTDARLSPLSLTYYGVCLMNGKYTVNLHFAEIKFTDNRTYSSLGTRIFDVYIQGTRVLKDFNIENEAGGVNKGIIKSSTTVVTDNTLEIRLYWAGKGTMDMPERGVYGPLISAISVDSNFIPSENGSLSAGAVVGIVIAAVVTIALVLGILWWMCCLRRKYTMRHDLMGLDIHTGWSFTLRQIKAATNDFDPANKIGEGGFGPVYKGVLLDGTIIAVKQLSSKSSQGNREFLNEICMISALQHPHLVQLYGCCIEGNQLLLVYEYMENNSLARALFDQEQNQLHLDWATRHKICIGIARGLAYLHEESRLKIVHRDIKATNVLLDGNLVPKISDFGLAKLHEEEDTHISTRIAGTFGYMAPEYAMRGYLTDKADVYSFGVVVLEVVSGRVNTISKSKGERFYLLDWANSLKVKGKLIELVDPRLDVDSKLKKEEVMRAINIALLCANAEASERPSMSTVVSMLEGRDGVEKLVSSSSISISISKDDQVEEEVDGISMDAAPWNDSSASAADLYPLVLDTTYWDNRPL